MPTLAVTIDSRRAKVGAAGFEAGTRRIQKGARAAGRDIDKLTKRTTLLGTRAKGVGSSLRALGLGMTAFFAASAVVKTIGSFEQSMQIVRGVTNATTEDFRELTATAREMGATTRFSATQAAQGMEFLARAGFNTEQVIAALPATLRLAQSGSIELGQAADFASNLVSQFGLEAAETARVVDVMVKTSNSANTNVVQMAEALKLAGPLASKMGVSIEEAAAAIGVLGDNGIQGTLAGTNLRGIMLALLNPTKRGRAAIKEMGLTMEDVNIETRGLTAVMQAFAEANITAKQAALIFRRQQVSGALAVAATTKKMKELFAANQDASGESQRMADIMDDSLVGAFFNLKSAISEAFLATGDSGLLGGLRQLVDVMTGAVRIIVGMRDEVKKYRVAAEVLAVALKALLVVTTAWIALKVVGFVTGMVTALAGATAATWAFNAALLANPIGLVIVAIAGLVAALVALGADWEDVVDVMKATFPALGIAADHWDDITTAVDKAAAALEGGVGSPP
jgi:TP901 family phage tail tape measure protein